MASLDFDAGNLLNPTKESGWGLMNPVEQEIRAKMWGLRKRLRDDPDACPIEWIISTRLDRLPVARWLRLSEEPRANHSTPRWGAQTIRGIGDRPRENDAPL